MTHTRSSALVLVRSGIFLIAIQLATASAQQLAPEPVVFKVGGAAERLELIVNSSRMLTLDQKIPRAQVNNRELVDLTPLSPNEIQIFAKKPGVTQINLWNERNEVHSIDLVIYGDARELSMLLNSQFPSASIKVTPLANSVVLSGFVDRPDHVSQIIRMAEDYYPKVIPNISVGGVQQVLLHVKVMEVDRTRARALGVNWSFADATKNIVSTATGVAAAATGATLNDSVRFGILSGDSDFDGFVEALRRHDLIKVLAEPTLVTVSGRAASFNAGGEIPYPRDSSTLGGVTVDWKKTGVEVDFVPIVLGNGNIRLEARPVVREVDETRSFTIGSGVTAPAFTVRQVDTGVEMKAGQTLAIAGLTSNRVEAVNSGIPLLADLPYVGVPFRRTREKVSEVELVILVTPELVEPLDPCEVPPCGPGMSSESPTDHQLYMKGFIEVPSRGPCGPGVPCGDGCTIHGPGAHGPVDGQIIYEGQRGYEEIDGVPLGARGQAGRGTIIDRTGKPVGQSRNARPSGDVARYNTSKAVNQPTPVSKPGESTHPGLIGPVGYDVLDK